MPCLAIPGIPLFARGKDLSNLLLGDICVQIKLHAEVPQTDRLVVHLCWQVRTVTHLPILLPAVIDHRIVDENAGKWRKLAHSRLVPHCCVAKRFAADR